MEVAVFFLGRPISSGTHSGSVITFFWTCMNAPTITPPSAHTAPVKPIPQPPEHSADYYKNNQIAEVKPRRKCSWQRQWACFVWNAVDLGGLRNTQPTRRTLLRSLDPEMSPSKSTSTLTTFCYNAQLHGLLHHTVLNSKGLTATATVICLLLTHQELERQSPLVHAIGQRRPKGGHHAHVLSGENEGYVGA